MIGKIESKNMQKFFSEHKWLEKQVKIIWNRIILPNKDIMHSLILAERNIKKYENGLDMLDKIEKIQLIWLNLRWADIAYFNSFEKKIRKTKEYKKSENIFNCKWCYDKTLSARELRKKFNPRLIELNNINNDEIIHAMDKWKPPNIKLIKELKEYFNILTTETDLTWYPQLNILPISKCSSCYRKK